MRRRKVKGPKKVSYRLIDAESSAGQTMYPLVKRLVHEHHGELREARIALAWATSWKADIDGRVKLGQLKKASDLDRELRPVDFVIVINRTFYEDANVSDAQREALLDHELYHGGRKLDTNGEDMVDERGRPVFRLRKHDLEEFAEIAERYGCWKRDLEAFAAALRRSKQGELFAVPKQQVKRPAARDLLEKAQAAGLSVEEFTERVEMAMTVKRLADAAGKDPTAMLDELLAQLDKTASAETSEPANGTSKKNGNGHGRTIPAAEFTRALKKECRDKGWLTHVSGDGKTVTIYEGGREASA